MAESHTYTWNQGTDLVMSLIYKAGPVGSAEPVDLSAYAFRMDIVAPDGNVLIVANDAEIEDVDPFEPNAQPDTSYEVTMNTVGEIQVTLNRSLTLPGGKFYKYISAHTPIRTFSYDMMLRDTSINFQTKVLEGTIVISPSVTLWE